MPHEIEQYDNVVLHKREAWHGMGIIVEDAPTPSEALKIAGLDWITEPWSLTAFKGNDEIPLKGKVVNVRSDVQIPLGIVSKGYTAIQNSELAEFSEALAEQGDVVKVESAGSIRNGSKVWFLLKGESFTVRDEDEVIPYILVSNGHDGMTPLRCTPTTVRVVCSNTLHMVIPPTGGKRARLAEASFSTRHIGDVAGKVEAAKASLRLYGKRLEENREIIDHLAAKKMTVDGVNKFFLECFTRDFHAVPKSPVNKKERRQLDKAIDGLARFTARFERDQKLAGGSAWNALNAYTGWIQHDRGSWFKDPEKARESKLRSRLFGVDAERGINALQTALSL